MYIINKKVLTYQKEVVSMDEKLTSFKLKKIIGYNRNLLDKDIKRTITNSILTFPFMGKNNYKFSFVKCEIIASSIIIGYFIQEFKAELHKYNFDKTEEKIDAAPFEDVFFILLLDYGLCFIREKKFSDKNISMSLIHENFKIALSTIFKNNDLGNIDLEDFSLLNSKEDFIRTFRNKNIISLKVGALRGKKIPEDYKIFNPNFERDKVVRNFLNLSIEPLNENEYNTGNEGGLQKSKLAEIILVTGEPKKLVYYGSNRKQKIIMKDKCGPLFKLDINVDQPNKNKIIEQIDSVLSSIIRDDHSIKGKKQLKLKKWEEDEN